MQPPACCQHSRCSDHTWDPLTDPFQDFWGEMKTLGAKQEVQQVKTLSVVGVIHLSGARVFTCAALRQAGGPTHPTAAGDEGGEAELANSTAQPGAGTVSCCSPEGQVC